MNKRGPVTAGHDVARGNGGAAAPLILPGPPADMRPALRALAVACFDLKEALANHSTTYPMSENCPRTWVVRDIDAEMVAFDVARRRVRDAFRAWEPVHTEN